jgi:hypothetical protein
MACPKALLIGINKFRNYPELELRGCVNDVKDVHKLLVQNLGFSEGNIYELLDGDATKREVVRNLQTLIQDARQGNCSFIFVHISSHGTRIPASGTDSEADYMDDAVVAHDIQEGPDGGWNKDTILSDNEVAEILAQIPPRVNAEIIFDTCHSGTMYRDFLETPFVVGRKIRYVAPPVSRKTRDIASRTFVRRGLREILQTQGSRDGTTEAPPSNVIAWGACEEKETAADANIQGVGEWRGAFSYYLCKTIRENQGMGRVNLIDKIKIALANDNYLQNPRLTCDRAFNEIPFGQSTPEGYVLPSMTRDQFANLMNQVLSDALQKLMAAYSTSSAGRDTSAAADASTTASKREPDAEKRETKSSKREPDAEKRETKS